MSAGPGLQAPAPVTPPIVVYGAARSGTTYLVQLLNQDPRIFVSDESRIFSHAHEALRWLGEIDGEVYRHRDELVGFLRRTLPATIREFYRELAPRAHWWGDKYPHYADPRNPGHLETILGLFPGARFLHIVRDGRDVVTSGMRGNWTDFDVVHWMWTSHLDLGCSFGRALPARQYFEFTYEDLVTDDPAMARRIFDFLEIDLHPAVERFCRDQQVRRTRFCTPSRDIKARGAQVSDWGTYFSPEQQLRSLELLGQHLIRFGYLTAESLEAARRRVAETVEAGVVR